MHAYASSFSFHEFAAGYATGHVYGLRVMGLGAGLSCFCCDRCRPNVYGCTHARPQVDIDMGVGIDLDLEARSVEHMYIYVNISVHIYT